MHATFTDFILVFFSLSLFLSQKNSTKFLSYLVLLFKALLTMGRYPNIKINASRTFQNIFIRPSGSQRRAGESQKGFMAPPGFWRFSWVFLDSSSWFWTGSALWSRHEAPVKSLHFISASEESDVSGNKVEPSPSPQLIMGWKKLI